MDGDARTDFEAFCADQWPRLVAAVDLVCGDVWVAEEVVQEALARAYERWDQVGRLESPGGWAYRVALNLATSLWRRRQVAMRRERAAREPAPIADSDGGGDVRAAVLALPVTLRKAIVLRFYMDWSVQQTAAALGITSGAVRARTHRAYGLLRRTLGDRLRFEEAL